MKEFIKSRSCFLLFLFVMSVLSTVVYASGDHYLNDSILTEQQQVVSASAPVKKWRFAIGAGYANRLGKRVKESDPAAEQVSKDLRHGFAIDGDVQYLFKGTWGLGLNADFIHSDASGRDVEIANGKNASWYEEKNSFFYIGPAFVTYTDLNRFILTTSWGIGPLFFRNDTNVLGHFTRTTFAMNAGVGMEYKISSVMGTGIKISYTMGTIGSVNYQGQKLELDERFNLSNLLLTGFLSFRTP